MFAKTTARNCPATQSDSNCDQTNNSPLQSKLLQPSPITMCWYIEMDVDLIQQSNTTEFQCKVSYPGDVVCICGQSGHAHFHILKHILKCNVCNLLLINTNEAIGLQQCDEFRSDEQQENCRRQWGESNSCNRTLRCKSDWHTTPTIAANTPTADSTLSAEFDHHSLSPTIHLRLTMLTEATAIDFSALSSCDLHWCSVTLVSAVADALRNTPSRFDQPTISTLFANHRNHYQIELSSSPSAHDQTISRLVPSYPFDFRKQGPALTVACSLYNRLHSSNCCGVPEWAVSSGCKLDTLHYYLYHHLRTHLGQLVPISNHPSRLCLSTIVFLCLLGVFYLARAFDCWWRLQMKVSSRLVSAFAELPKSQTICIDQTCTVSLQPPSLFSSAATTTNTQRASSGNSACHSISYPTLSALPDNGTQSSTAQNVVKSIARLSPKGGHTVNRYMLLLLAILCIHLNVKTCDAIVKIHQIKMPKSVENGTENSVVLDCIYSLDPKTDQNLVVKWFFNEDSEPIYQWIVELNSRHVPKRYEGRVNPNYRVNTTNPWQMYRALNLIRPTVDFNGRYSCHILSIFSQDSAEANLIVYAKTKSIDLVTRRVVKERSTALQQTVRHQQHNQSPLDVPSAPDLSNGWSSSSAAGLSSSWLFDQYGSRLSSASTTEIQCTVQNVYPLPELTIYQVLKDGLRPRSLENARLTQNVTQLPNGAFTVSVTAYIEDAELIHNQQQQVSLDPTSSVPVASSSGNSLGAPTIFECLVAQDEIRHELRKRTLYTPAFDDSDYDTSAAFSQGPNMAKTILTLVALVAGRHLTRLL